MSGHQVPLSAQTVRWSVAAIAGAVGIWFLASSMPFLPPPSTSDIGAGGFPALVAIALLIAAARVWWRHDGRHLPPDTIRHAGRVAGTLVAVAVLAVLLQTASYVAIAVFAAVLQWIHGERRWLLLLGGSALIALLMFGLFGRLLKLAL